MEKYLNYINGDLFVTNFKIHDAQKTCVGEVLNAHKRNENKVMFAEINDFALDIIKEKLNNEYY